MIAASCGQYRLHRSKWCYAQWVMTALSPMGYDRSDMVREASDKLYQDLMSAGIEVILDDRGERPGAMFADWELIGVPYRVVIGERGLKEGQLEFQARTDAEA
ncbi:MAG: hypothetical protein RL615_696, partial [Pseudomonadota bacterium]